jgi:biotin transport system substrate-specific component
MTRCALFGALLCLISPICIPIGPIPISLAVFAVMLIAQVLPRYEALTVVCLYLVLGALGLPVFAGFSGGVGALLGATGGFIFSYPLLALCAGVHPGRKEMGVYLGCTLGVLVSYLCGLLWYCYVASPGSLQAALVACILPFLPIDALKIVLAVWFSKMIKARIK